MDGSNTIGLTGTVIGLATQQVFFTDFILTTTDLGCLDTLEIEKQRI